MKLYTELTEKRALQICFKLWEWLAKNPSKFKQDWPEWKKIEKTYGVFLAHCPCCQYVWVSRMKKHNGDIFSRPFCQNSVCPLAGYAWSKKSFACEVDKSPFTLWIRTKDLNAKRRYAFEIADACRKALKDMSPSIENTIW